MNVERTMLKAANGIDGRGSYEVATRFPLPSSIWQSLGESLHLSGRELQIVCGIFDGGTEASIARDLDLSSHTVHSHLDRLYRKLHVSNRCALAVRVFAEYLALQGQEVRSESASQQIVCAAGEHATGSVMTR